MAAYKGFPKHTRKIIFARAKARCQNCGKKWDDGWMLECHHIVPVTEGGSHNVSNGELLCIRCHAAAHSSLSAVHKSRGNVKLARANAGAARMTRKRNPRRYGY